MATTVKDTQVGDDDTTSMTDALVGLAGFRLLAAADLGGELELLVETTADLVPWALLRWERASRLLAVEALFRSQGRVR